MYGDVYVAHRQRADADRHDPDRTGDCDYVPVADWLRPISVARRMSEAVRERAAYQASLRTIRRGERPAYRVVPAQHGSWRVLGREWLAIDANDRRSAVEGTRAAVAEWLGVEPDAFDVETEVPGPR